MVLVTNEWPNKSEDEQKSPTSSSSLSTTASNVNSIPSATTTTTGTRTLTTTSSTITVIAASGATASKANKTNASSTISEPSTPNSSSTIGALTSQALSPIDVTGAAATASGTALFGAPTSSTLTITNSDQNRERHQEQLADMLQKVASEEPEEDTLSNSSTISDFDESSVTLNENDNNNRKITTTRTSSNSTPSGGIQNNDIAYANEAVLQDLDIEQEQDQDDEDQEDQEQAYYNRISSNELSSALYSAFKSMKPIDNSSNKRTSSTTVAVTTPNTATNTTTVSAPPTTANNTISNTYLSTFGMGINVNNMQQQQHQQPLKSGYTAITTNILDAQQANNNNNINTMNNNNNINCNIVAADSGSSCPILNDDNKNEAKIVLLCEPKSHPFKTRTIPLTPKIECKVGRLIARSKALETNAIFDCKVLSRNHAVLWYTDDGKFWVKDTKSSNGTFINDRKLGNEAAELHFGDVVKFGVDVWENSRKETHGCIIALVRLYLPDGREATDPDTQRTQFSGEGRISYDEIHRLNMFMQEAAAREKGLKTKLCSIQNVLDITRKNSALCWQSMVNEDQLLHRINSLEKKLQIMDKNVPESVLRNEVLKLLDDKNSYQITAKEALRKVYQERCDALQMLAKVEADYAQAENECTLLREGIAVTKQSMQEINERLMQLESEYHEYKEDIQRQQLEAKVKEEEHVLALREQLEQREIECENLQRQIVQLQKAATIAAKAPITNAQNETAAAAVGKSKNRKKTKSAGSSVKDDDTVGTTDTDDEEKEVIEKLDAAIDGFLSIDDDDDESDDSEDDDEDDDNEEHYAEQNVQKKSGKHRNNDKKRTNDSSDKQIKSEELDVLSELEKALQTSETFNGKNDDVNDKMGTSKRKKQKSNIKAEKDLKQKIVKKSTIMKWLKNSDLNKKEGSIDIFKAMFNNEDTEDSNGEQNEADSNKYNKAGAGANKKQENQINQDEYYGNNLSSPCDEEYDRKCNNFKSKLQNVQNNLDQLEAEIANETKEHDMIVVASDVIAKDMDDDSDDTDEDDDDDEEVADNEFIIKRNGATPANIEAKETTTTRPKQNRSYILLKQSIDMLREAFNEISMVKPQSVAKSEAGTRIDKETQYHKQGARLQTQETLKPSKLSKKNECEQDENEASSAETENVFLDNENDESVSICSEDSISQKRVQAKGTNNSIEEQETAHRRYEQQIKLLEMQISDMRKQMQNSENDAQHTLEIMQIECDTYKLKLNDLALVIDTLREEKQELESAIKENTSNSLESSNTEVATADNTATLQINRNKTLQQTVESDSTKRVIGANGSDGTSSDAFLNLSIDSCKSDSIFEKEIHEERAAALALEREEELVAFKERLEQQHQINHNLLMEIDELKQKAISNTQYALIRQVLPIGAIAIAVLVYFATQNIFK